MYPSRNTRSVPAVSITTLASVPFISYYFIKYDLDNTVKAVNNNTNALFDKLLDKSDKQDAKLDKQDAKPYKQDETLESILAHITNQDSQIDNKIKTQLQPVSLQITEISSKFSTYENCL